MHAQMKRLIVQLELEPHPEGGFYREVFRSATRVSTSGGAVRDAMTSIYYLLPGNAFSAWHRLSSDETWHFYQGSSLVLTIIHPTGLLERRSLGPEGPWQTTVPSGAFFAAHVADGEGYALVGCVVAPGFEFADFQLATYQALTTAYPQHRELIGRYIRETSESHE